MNILTLISPFGLLTVRMSQTKNENKISLSCEDQGVKTSCGFSFPSATCGSCDTPGHETVPGKLYDRNVSTGGHLPSSGSHSSPARAVMYSVSQAGLRKRERCS